MKSQSIDHVLIKNTVLVTSITSLVEGYILNCQCENKSEATISNYRYRLRCFLWFCQANSYPDEPHKITPDHIRQFLWYVASEPARWGGSSTSARKPADQSTVNCYYWVLNTFFNWLKREGFIPDNPVSHLKTPKLDKKVIQAFTVKEIESLINECSPKTYSGSRNRAILMMFLDSGMRVSELANINLDDIDINSGSILIRKGKGAKQRVVRIGSKAQKTLWRYVSIYRRGDCNRLFLNRSGESLTTTGLKLMIRRLGKKAEVNGVHIHMLRHTFAISFLRSGGDIFSLQYLLGHNTLQMTQRYLQSLTADDAINTHQRCSPLDNMFKK